MKAEITVQGDRFHVRTPYHPILADRFGQIPSRQWHPLTKTWSFPIVRDCLAMVMDVCGLLPQALPEPLREIALGLYDAVAPAPVDMSLLDGHVFQTAPYEHQRVNLARLMQHDRWLIADEMGCGKSAVVCNRIKSLGTGVRTLIVCYKSVIWSWQRELMLHAGLDCSLAIGDKLERQHAIWYGRNVVVANYEAILHTQETFLKSSWDCLIIDEVQRVKNLTAQCSRVLQKLSEKATYVYGLSGTPATNGLQDWLGVLNAIDPEVLGCPTKTAFNQRYCLMGRLGGQAQGPITIVGYRNVAELHQKISSVTSRVTKAEALDLPPKVYSTRTVRLEGEQARVYRDIRRDAVARLKTAQREGTLTVRNVLNESGRLLQVIGGFVPDDEGNVYELDPKAKIQAIKDILDEVGDKPVVFWCAFRAEVAFLATLLSEGGDRVSTLVGGMSDDGRRESIDAFAKGDSRFFVATAAAGGTGINGLQVADTEVYYSRDYNLATYLQSQDRLHRIGQKNTVSVIKIMAQNTVDEKVDASLESKRDMLEMMLNSPEEML